MWDFSAKIGKVLGKWDSWLPYPGNNQRNQEIVRHDVSDGEDDITKSSMVECPELVDFGDQDPRLGARSTSSPQSVLPANPPATSCRSVK